MLDLKQINFNNPPLNEVVIGVQFSPPNEYNQLYAFEVWNLYKKDYPQVQEKPYLPSSFETFGISQTGHQIINLGGANHDRFWFISENGNELIQFQNDKLFHNWRKLEDEASLYPRYDAIIKKFSSELDILLNYFKKFDQRDTIINQCEISYISHIKFDITDQDIMHSFFNCFNFKEQDASDFAVTFRRSIKRDNNPVGRLICDIKVANDQKGNPMILVNLTVRGAPASGRREDAIKFINEGHNSIIETFENITTKEAHRIWGKEK
jgi:uncharacterized protein (TIGR04255 family)